MNPTTNKVSSRSSIKPDEEQVSSQTSFEHCTYDGSNESPMDPTSATTGQSGRAHAATGHKDGLGPDLCDF